MCAVTPKQPSRSTEHRCVTDRNVGTSPSKRELSKRHHPSRSPMNGSTCCAVSSPTLAGEQLNLLARCTVSAGYVIIVCGFLWVCHRAVHTDSTRIKSILATFLRIGADARRTRASASDAETLKVKEVVAAMRESRMGFCVLIVHQLSHSSIACSWCME